MSIGLNLYDEQLNDQFDVTTVSGIAAYHLPIHKGGQISTAMSFGYYGQRFGRNSGSWENQHNGLFYDPDLPTGEQFSTLNRTAFDVGTGVVYSLAGKHEGQKLLQFGMVTHHLGRPDVSFLVDGSAKLPIRLALHGSSSLYFAKQKYMIQPMFLFQKQREFQSFNIGVMGFMRLKESAKTTSSFDKVRTCRLGAGLFVRNGDAMIFNVAMQMSNWNLGLAYDVTTSALKQNNQSRGAFEIQLQYMIPSFLLSSRY